MKINELKIYTPQLDEQKAFYSNILRLKGIKMNNERASFQLENSVLTLEYRKETTPYHFAINIPANKEKEALNWLKKRVEILKDENSEIHDFESWNAKAIYFYDYDKNIVELISRNNLDNETVESFNQDQFLCLSEIGLPTTDIESKYRKLNQLTGIQKFDGGFDRFLAFGDEEGLFICINKERKDWFPIDDKAHSSDFELEFIENGIDYRMEYRNDQIFLT